MHKILLVEDNAVIRQQVKKMLEQWGFEVVAVEDFMQVLTIFAKEEPHLVLMDIGLPLFNGYHWCQEIRKISKVPIMFLSSRDQAMDIVMAINMGEMTLSPSLLTTMFFLLKCKGCCGGLMSLERIKAYWNIMELFSISSPWIWFMKVKSLP